MNYALFLDVSISYIYKPDINFVFLCVSYPSIHLCDTSDADVFHICTKGSDLNTFSKYRLKWILIKDIISLIV